MCLKIVKTKNFERKIYKISFLVLFLLFFSPVLVSADDYYEYALGQVVSVGKIDLYPDDSFYKASVSHVMVKIKTGKFSGQIVEAKNYIWNEKGYNIDIKKGSNIVVKLFKENGHINDAFVIFNKRSTFLYIYFAILIIIAIIIGRKKGIWTITSLAVLYIVIFFFLPSLLKSGHSAILISIFAGLISSFMTLFLVGGFNRKSLSAFAGVSAGLFVTAMLAYLAFKYNHLTGATTYQGRIITKMAGLGPYQIRALYISGVIIAATGILMDVSLSIASGTSELYINTPDISFKNLLGSSLKIASEVTGSMANTLIIAFLGNLLPLFMIFIIMKIPFIRWVNWEFFLMAALVPYIGSIGLLVSAPLSAFFSALIYFYKGKPCIQYFNKFLIVIVILFGGFLFSWGQRPDIDYHLHPLKLSTERSNRFYSAKILKAEPKVIGERYSIPYQTLTVKYKGKITEIKNYLWGRKLVDKIFNKGDLCVIRTDKRGNNPTINGYNRIRFIISSLIFFGLLFIVLGSKKGVFSLLSILSVLGLYALFLFYSAKGYLILPGVIAFIFISLIFIIGFILGPKRIALPVFLSSLIGMSIVVLLSIFFIKIFHINGFTMESIQELNYFTKYFLKKSLDIYHIIYAVIIIGAVGAVSDVAIGIGSSLEEIKKYNPRISFKSLVHSGFNIGRDMMGTMFNTLLLAYTGGSLILILSWMLVKAEYIRVSNMEFIAIEVTRAFSSTIGLMLTVPISVFFVSYYLSLKKSNDFIK